jgi:tetratricopeptide (TPR) repeat protein
VPSQGPDLETAAQLASAAAAPGFANATLAKREWTEGLAEYRRGQYESAISWMDKAIATASREDLPAWSYERQRNRAAGASLVQAMACQQLQQDDEARLDLARALDIIRAQCPQADSGDVGREWPDWLTVQILEREASQLITGGSQSNPQSSAQAP